jgi:small subunit ribosomal protein S12
MLTKNQIIKGFREKRKIKNKKLKLQKCPQKKGICSKVFTGSPKKPNSAARKLAKVRLVSTDTSITCHIPGIGNPLQQFSVVLVCGAYLRDLPGVKYRVIRGKFDATPVYERKTARSKYGRGLDKD